MSIKLHYLKPVIFRYLSLVLGLAGLAAIFWFLWPNRLALRLVSLVLGVFYVLWGTVVHLKSGRVSLRVVAEYLGVALLGSLMLWLVI
ncbi:MAG TPA: hypothetical protein DEP87_01890 [Candidatus Pacebacteria bacterium]|nr:hypothetical protein [Candidatus Paceibacterota bacterium]